MIRRRIAVLFVLWQACRFGISLEADEPAPSPSEAAARRIVEQWHDGLRKAHDLGCEIATKVEVAKDGAIASREETSYQLTLQRPNKLAMRTTGGPILELVADGREAYAYVESLNKDQRAAAPPATLEELAATKFFALVNFRMGLGLLGDGLKSTSSDDLWGIYRSPEYVGVAEKNGVRAHLVRLTRQTMPFDVWFAADNGRLLAIEPDLKIGLAGDSSLPPGVTYSISTVYRGWRYDEPPAADAFAIAPRDGADRVSDLFVPARHTLVGRPAPAFTTTDPADRPVKLADLSGKVVLLDFWATWCGPCVRALPKIEATAAKFKDRDVVFYAVNQQEEAATILEFLTARQLDVPVALDLDGAIHRAYGVDGIPQIVIIDRKGKVQAVRVGAGPNIGDDIAHDLEAVLAGRDLTPGKPAN